MKRTWVEINLRAIVHNLKEVKKRVGKSVKVLAAIKADGYGHGAVKVGKVLAKNGIDFLGVATLEEALELKKGRIDVPILIFSPIDKTGVKEVVKYGIRQTIFDLNLARALNLESKRRKKEAKVHIKVDTGMGRIGVRWNEAIKFIKEVSKLKNLSFEGIFTHFSSADEDMDFSKLQLERFKKVLNGLKKEEISIPLGHAANSAAILNLRGSYFDMVRPGLLIYGLYPSLGSKKRLRLMPAMTLKTRVVHLKEVPARTPISYGGTYVTKRRAAIATLPIGYGDGLTRHLSNKGEVLIRGIRAPIAGRICMDQTMVDVGHIPGVKVGDEAVVIGRQRKEKIFVEEIADKVKTVPHEIVTQISKRVPRLYA